MREIPLHQLAHGRTGDKGNIVNISVIAYRAEDYPLLVEQVTPERVAAHFGHRQPTAVKRHLLPNLGAMNFVLDDVLDGGVNDSLNLDSHGKALSFHLLAMAVSVGSLARTHPTNPPSTDPGSATLPSTDAGSTNPPSTDPGSTDPT